ncbi:MAG: type II toxin-antitoxin system VapC family toxin [Candidatus Latescibacteria bacterium]|nr:type II toxin-antitoxin system VapC family toxin [Candidatus Latescibacterota bacterium]
MLNGLDTGFFLRLKEDDPVCTALWAEIKAGQEQAIIPVITLHEILVIYYQRGQADIGRELIAQWKMISSISTPPITAAIAERAAGLRHGLGMHTSDSLILSTCLTVGCRRLYTGDSGFDNAHKQGIIEVIQLKTA